MKALSHLASKGSHAGLGQFVNPLDSLNPLRTQKQVMGSKTGQCDNALLNPFAASLVAQDPRKQKLIAAVLDDFERARARIGNAAVAAAAGRSVPSLQRLALSKAPSARAGTGLMPDVARDDYARQS